MTNLWLVIFRLAVGAVLCALLRSLPLEGAVSKLMQLLCGAFMLVSLIAPFAGGFNEFEIFDLPASDAQSIIENAKADSLEEMKEIIIEETEAYILDKANKFSAELTVEVSVDDSELPTPCAVTIEGSISPYARQQLQQIIADDLGICVEDQRWIG